MAQRQQVRRHALKIAAAEMLNEKSASFNEAFDDGGEHDGIVTIISLGAGLIDAQMKYMVNCNNLRMRVIFGVALVLMLVIFVTPMAAGGRANICADVSNFNAHNARFSLQASESGLVYKTVYPLRAPGLTRNASNAAPEGLPAMLRCTARFWETI